MLAGDLSAFDDPYTKLDIPVPLSAADYFAGIDSALDAILDVALHREHEDRGHHDDVGGLPSRPLPAVGIHAFGYRTICVQRWRAIVRPVASFVTVTSHT